MTVLTLPCFRPPRRWAATLFLRRRTTNAANRIKLASPTTPTKQPSAK
jgi:hypothetical protein